MMEIRDSMICVKEIQAVITGPDSLKTWLVEQALDKQMSWLLAYADDGVIWGYVRNAQLHLSGDAFPEHSPVLHPLTLQKARLFSETGEVFLWKTGNGFSARVILEGSGAATPAYDCPYRLWGMATGEPARDGFVRMSEGENGLFHTPPLLVAGLNGRFGVELILRNYIAYEEGSGQAYVRLSRLVGFKNTERQQ